MKAVSPLLGFVITISLIFVATTIALTVIKPVFDRIKDSIIINEGMENLELINSVIKQVASESEESKRTISLTVTDGEFKLNATEDYIYFDYETKSDYALEGIIENVRIKTNKGNMILSIPYLNIDLNGTARFPKGNYQLAIENKGLNNTTNKPIVELTLV